jgi:uncharacterized protein (DUF1778 family)
MTTKAANTKSSRKSDSKRVQEQTRFDARLSLSKKQMFEKAAAIAGYKSLSEFIFSTVTEKAQKILSDNEAILASQKDNDIFFSALLNEPEPNEALIGAAKDYKTALK